MRGSPLIIILASVLSLSACSLRTVATRATAGILDRGSSVFYEEPDPALARDAMPGQLKLVEALLKNDPRNAELLKTLSEGFTGYAFLFVEDEAPERAGRLYDRAAGYAASLLAVDGIPDVERMSPEALEGVLKKAGTAAVPGLYWTAYAWALQANLSPNDPEALSRIGKAERMMRRVLELDPGFKFGGPDLFFGVYYSVRPRMAGGDLDKAKAHFEAAVARTGGRYLMARTLYAKYYAVAALDEALFRSLNEGVLSSNSDEPRGAVLENQVAQLKSKRLLEKIDDLF